jgi:hypothetical protein
VAAAHPAQAPVAPVQPPVEPALRTAAPAAPQAPAAPAEAAPVPVEAAEVPAAEPRPQAAPAVPLAAGPAATPHVAGPGPVPSGTSGGSESEAGLEPEDEAPEWAASLPPSDLSVPGTPVPSDVPLDRSPPAPAAPPAPPATSSETVPAGDTSASTDDVEPDGVPTAEAGDGGDDDVAFGDGAGYADDGYDEYGDGWEDDDAGEPAAAPPVRAAPPGTPGRDLRQAAAASARERARRRRRNPLGDALGRRNR